jgi:DNA replication protein DnaC
MTSPAPAVTAELKTLLRAVKLGRCLDTLPERLALAKQRDLTHHQFLELILADEVTRRETSSASLRARTAGLDPDMALENWDPTTKVNYDHQVFDELCSLRFIDAGHNSLILGPVGVGKTFMATALGHAAIRRRYSVAFFRADVLLKKLRASRLDNSHDAEIRKLLRVDLLVLDLCRHRDYPDTGRRAAGASPDLAGPSRCNRRSRRDSHRPSRKARSLSLGR